MWVVGYCAVGPLAYWLPNWRQLIFTTSAPMLLFALVYYFTVPESFHYLVSKGDHNKVTEWMQKANSSANQLGTPKVMDITATHFCNHSHAIKTKLLKDETSFPQTGLLQQLLSSKVLSLYTLVMLYLWTCDTFVYYGLSLHSTQISGNKFLNFAFMGLIEIPSYLISPFMLNSMPVSSKEKILLGRPDVCYFPNREKRFVSLCHFLAAASFFTILFTDDSRISLAMWLLGKFSISCAFTSLFVYASEVFPTVARNGCIGICSMVARIGGAFAPTVRTMSLISPMIPTVLFGVSAGIGGILTLILPETSNEQLPNSIDQMTCRTVRKIKPEMC
uniref:Organic cation transporter n=1 Tax=Ditylenchus dipsaci TaxID=166011 RepID=A0A915DQD1_9BILA